MFKKTVLIAVLLLLFSSSVVYAPIDIELPAQNVVPISPADDESQQLISDLWVWLEVPEALPAPGNKFLVDLYITPFGSYFKKTFKLKFKPSNNRVEFTGYVENLVDGIDQWTQVYADSNDGSISLTRSYQELTSTNLFKKRKIGSLEMEVNNVSSGNFQINLVKAESEAWSNDNGQYTLKQANTRIIKNSFCIPNLNACSGKCGVVNDGCGKLLTCSGCAADKICVNSACVTAVSQLPAASQPACQAVMNTTAASDKVLLQTIGETLQGWGKSCTVNADCKAGYSCKNNACTATELSILSPIFTAIKGWLNSKFVP